ncbi:MAG: hypothetical protein QOI73_333 [Solirubrobacteraceae bacterium]|nr:hypothetical protein [Solirubrobacteraceae bacterium]
MNPRLAVLAALAALAVVLPAAALHAASGTVDVEDIRIVGTPTLHVERFGSGAGYNSAWVVFRTSERLHVVRQIVAEVHGLRGRSYTASGARTCVRSTVISAAKVIKPGNSYRVRFYGRPGSTGAAKTLLKTATLTARRFVAPAGRFSVPHC